MTNQDINARFERLVDDILHAAWEFYPGTASRQGLHEYDGRISDFSPAALSRRAQYLREALDRLGKLDASSLSMLNRFDYSLLSTVLRKELFDLTELRVHQNNPMEVLPHVELGSYIRRDYAPLTERVGSLTEALRALPSLVATIRENLSASLGGAVLEASIESYQGLVAFYEKDLPAAVKSLDDVRLKRDLEDARSQASQSLTAFVEHLKSLRAKASEKFAIGEEKFLALLRHGEMVELPLERILKVGEEDLARNKARFLEIARQIDSSKTPEDVMRGIAKHHPDADSLVSETRDMLEQIREFLIDYNILTVPSEVRCIVAETPSFMRWATAALDMPGAFETAATEAYYYVTPVEPHWTDGEKEEWLSNLNYAVLENTSIHEAYPGHYVHYLHTKRAPSKVSKMYGAYSFWEGWAHYTEEMMMEAGYADGNPRLLLGQLSDALLRNCRYVCAIRMHARGMTVEEATRFFIENGYMEELPARKEAQRGAFDPMYLNYTLGKLMILRLREDFKREQGEAYSLKRFHDTFLSFGAPPIPLVRQMMLRNPGSDVL